MQEPYVDFAAIFSLCKRFFRIITIFALASDRDLILRRSPPFSSVSVQRVRLCSDSHSSHYSPRSVVCLCIIWIISEKKRELFSLIYNASKVISSVSMIRETLRMHAASHFFRFHSFLAALKLHVITFFHSENERSEFKNFMHCYIWCIFWIWMGKRCKNKMNKKTGEVSKRARDEEEERWSHIHQNY